MMVVLIVGAAFVYALIKQVLESRSKERERKLSILETALRQGDLDDEGKDELLTVLTGRVRRPAPRQPTRIGSEVGFFMKAFALFGWLALCLGVAFLILDLNYNYGDEFGVAAAVLMCSGFGLVTYPFVIRELQSGGARPHGRGEQRTDRHRV